MVEIRRARFEDMPGVYTCCVHSFRDYILRIGQTPGPMRVSLENQEATRVAAMAMAAAKGGV